MKASSLRRGLIAAVLAAPLLLAACSDEPHPKLVDIEGVNMSDADFGKDFKLADTEGVYHSLADYRGKAVLVFFGFTQCPDVCPTALTRAAETKELLGEDGERLQVIFITLDPERDTPEVLRSYTQAFDPSFVALRPSLPELEQTARDFKVFYQKVPTGSSYTMDHSALTYVYDTEGRLQLALRHTQTAEEAADDIRQVLALND